METKTLPLQHLADRHPGLTAAIAASYTEAACVCLERHHRSPVSVEITSSDSVDCALVEWVTTDERTKAAWANQIDTTEAGAYACVLAAVELSCGLVAIHRAETRTGADYYIAPAGAESDDLEYCLRLEVSGIDCGGPAAVNRRLSQKMQQAAEGASNLPAMAGVVCFQARVIGLGSVEDL